MQNSFKKWGSLALLITGCVADYDDGVTNNDDGSGGNAPCLKNFIGGFDYSTLGDDPHAVMGLEANDGGYVAIGSGLYSEGSKPSQGFIMKTSGSCTYTDYEYITLSSSETDCDKTWDWVSTFGTAGGKNAALWVAESIDNTYFIVVGIHSQSNLSYVDMYIAKYLASDGSLVWEFTQEATSSTTNAGLETVAFTSDGGFVVGGFTDSSLGISDMYFKSGGQVDEGIPFFGKISATDAAASSAPTSWEWSYSSLTTDTDDETYRGSAKSIRVDSSDNVFGLVSAGATLVKLTSTGTKDWDTGTALSTYGQMNDLELVSDGIVMTGHTYSMSTENCWGTGCGVIKGTILKVDTDGAFSWVKSHGNYPGGINQFADLVEGQWELIYTECWGIAPTYDTDLTTQNGFVISCGSGIEGCGGIPKAYPSLLLACYTEPRATWRSLTIATDLNGDRVWSRQDSFQTEESNEVWSSAAEFVFNTADGGSVSVTDEAMGIGFAVFEPYTNTACTATYDYINSATKLGSAMIAVAGVYIS